MQLRAMETNTFWEARQQELIRICRTMWEVQTKRDVGQDAVGPTGVHGANTLCNINCPPKEKVRNYAKRRSPFLVYDIIEKAEERIFETLRRMKELYHSVQRQVLGALGFGR
ncbi:hypothetical protein I3760_02G059000 [Carya illinoinensis]|nr:hypothetical protein I3760_02G059000 [Carya illinoinensis]